MESKFKHIIETDFSFIKDEKFLLAVSGGVDSMVLLHLCSKLNLNFEVAHCNYQLRGKDSDLDAELVKKACQDLDIKFHIKTFEIDTDNTSIQTEARDLRYGWFNELLPKRNAKYVMLAHHLNDQLETMLINLSRSTGIRGIKGMSLIHENKLRPLLSIEKKEILAFAKENHIQWREDVSNEKDDYKRNFIRHQISPLLEQLHPNFWENINKSSELLNAQAISLQEVYSFERQSIVHREEYFEVSIIKIRDWYSKKMLIPILEKYEILPSQENALNELTNSENGKKLITSTHSFIKMDESIYIHSNETNYRELIIKEPGNYSLSNQNIQVKQYEGTNYNPEGSLVQLDLDKIDFPITIRNIKNGDRFQPLGMKGKKLVNDYLKDKKINQLARLGYFVIESNNTILAILNCTVNEQFKIDINTKNILEIGTFANLNA